MRAGLRALLGAALASSGAAASYKISELEKLTTSAPTAAAAAGVTAWTQGWVSAMIQWTAGNQVPWFDLWASSEQGIWMHDWGQTLEPASTWPDIQTMARNILPPITAANPVAIYYSKDALRAGVVWNFTIVNGPIIQFMDYVTFNSNYKLRSLEVFFYLEAKSWGPALPETAITGNSFAVQYAASLLTSAVTSDWMTFWARGSYTPTLTDGVTTTSGYSAITATSPAPNYLSGVVVKNLFYTGLLPGIKYALEMEFTEIGQIFTHPWTTYKEVHIIHMLDTSLSCAGWCNAYTCSLEACTSCNVCADLTAGLHCSGWCNPWTSWFSHCSGC